MKRLSLFTGERLLIKALLESRNEFEIVYPGSTMRIFVKTKEKSIGVRFIPEEQCWCAFEKIGSFRSSRLDEVIKYINSKSYSYTK